MKITDDKTKIEAFCNAIDEGDASPDVTDFNAEDFIAEMKQNWKDQ